MSDQNGPNNQGDENDFSLDPEIEERLAEAAKRRARMLHEIEEERAEKEKRVLGVAVKAAKAIGLVGPAIHIAAGLTVVFTAASALPVIAGAGVIAYNAYNASRVMSLQIDHENLERITDNKLTKRQQYLHLAGHIATCATGVALVGVAFSGIGIIGAVTAGLVGASMALKGGTSAIAMGGIAFLTKGTYEGKKRAEKAAPSKDYDDNSPNISALIKPDSSSLDRTQHLRNSFTPGAPANDSTPEGTQATRKPADPTPRF